MRDREIDNERIRDKERAGPSYRCPERLMSCSSEGMEEDNPSDTEELEESLPDSECSELSVGYPMASSSAHHLNVSHIRTVLANVTGAAECQIDRIFVEKRAPANQTGDEDGIKIIVTDEYLDKIAKPLYLANLICSQFK